MMDAPGSYFLLIDGTDFSIGAPGSYVGDWSTGLEGMSSVSVQCDFRAGANSGEADVRAYLQTSLDDGNTVIDIACMLFTANERRVINLSASAPVQATVATDGALADDTILDGILGERLRLKVVSTGNWTNTYLGGRMVAR